MSKASTETDDTNLTWWHTLATWQIVLILIIFFPLGFFLIWKQNKWSKKYKQFFTIASAAVIIGIIVLANIFAPPTITVTSPLASIKSDTYQLTGKIYPSGSKVMVNGQAASVKGDTFTSSVPLKEGDNTIRITVIDGDKQAEQAIKIHRYTKAELIAQEKAEEKKRAEAAARKAKAEAEAEAKRQQEAAAKAKEAEIAAAKATEEKAKAEAAAKAKAEAAALAAATVSQKNALSKAKSYISYTAFSHDGLIDQLMYEKFSLADATYGADHVGVNWNEQAAKKAKEYMSYSSFSRDGLIDQLIYEKFTSSQAAYGATSVGL